MPVNMPDPDELIRLADILRDQVQAQFPSAVAERPHRMILYFDGAGDLIGFSATVWANSVNPMPLARIDIVGESIYLARSESEMIQQGSTVLAHIKRAYVKYSWKGVTVPSVSA